MFLNSSKPLLAIDIGANSIKMAQLAGSPGRYELISFGIMPLEPESVVDGMVRNEEHVVEALTKLLKAENIDGNHYAVSSVAGEAVIIKKIEVPVMPEDELAESVSQEAEQYIPFEIDDVRLDFQILDRVAPQEGFEDLEEEEKQEIILVAVQNDLIENRTEVLTAAGLKPVILDLDVFAMANALAIQRDLEGLGAAALIDLGASFTHVNLLQDGISVFTRDIPMGGDACTGMLGEKFGLEYKETEALKRGIIPEDLDQHEVIDALVESFDGIIEEINKSFEFFSSTSNSQVEQVFLCGGGALIPGVDALMSDRLIVPVEIFNPLETVKISSKKFDRESIHRMAPLASVVTGLATRRFDYK